MNRKEHWEAIYAARQPTELSGFQSQPALSLDLIERAAPSRSARIRDVGRGASTLVDGLLSAGYRNLTVMDLSPSALDHARRRLGAASSLVTWMEGDILSAELPRQGFDVWHDRAVFHFLTDADERSRYRAQVRHTVPIGGHVLVATFADDGPPKCSGLTVARYTPDALHAEFGEGFRPIESRREVHVTPSEKPQAFVHCLWRVEHEAASHAA